AKGISNSSRHNFDDTGADPIGNTKRHPSRGDQSRIHGLKHEIADIPIPMKYLTAIFILVSSPSWGAIAYVQSKACGALGATSSSCAFDSAVTQGSLIVAPCAGSRLGASLTVTDDNGNHYSLINGTHTTSVPSGGTLVFG